MYAMVVLIKNGCANVKPIRHIRGKTMAMIDHIRHFAAAKGSVYLFSGLAVGYEHSKGRTMRQTHIFDPKSSAFYFVTFLKT